MHTSIIRTVISIAYVAVLMILSYALTPIAYFFRYVVRLGDR